ncbi:hypothetical protein JMJ55_27740 [Belnapia sp. T6]|uniref:Uncharacterized protein n=1 Tax=Belnapia mucosa TaxID=2804532 RepID=A0ABS1VBR9_9PROT|nr:hypothetical protein [Belnapia mucosa]MBL6459121.1 hypothetical protein [Belnapia mucosa]
MQKHVILADNIDSTQIRYFVGYKDDGGFCEAFWTFDPWRARWVDAVEAAVEVKLLATLCPNYQLKSCSLDVIGNLKA